jgi:hypothetical protein
LSAKRFRLGVGKVLFNVLRNEPLKCFLQGCALGCFLGDERAAVHLFFYQTRPFFGSEFGFKGFAL